MRPRSFDLFGIRFHAVTKRDLVAAVAQAVADRTRCVIADYNLHFLYLCCHMPEMREFNSSAEYTHIDGLSMILLGRLFGLPLRSGH